MIFGIDFGSKYAGTTAICMGNEKGKVISVVQGKKKASADEFIRNEILKQENPIIFIDAPLTLPGIYRNFKGFDDYFYRKCDREIGAMSPMFLGGLTARAIKLKDFFEAKNIKMHEVWPTKLAVEMKIPGYLYKASTDNIEVCVNIIKKRYNYFQLPLISNWHQFDAFLAYLSGVRFINQENLTFGSKKEGIIYV